MLLTTVTESNPIYQFCEECVNNYLQTEDDAWIEAIITEASTSSHLNSRIASMLRHEGKDEPPSFGIMRDEAVKNNPNNPFAARKAIGAVKFTDSQGTNFIPSRAQGVGIRQNQGRFIQALTFWTHPKTQQLASRLTAGIAGLGALAKINEYRNKPKTVIAQKIASLRKILANFKSKMAGSKSEQEKNILKKACAKIVEAIDKLLHFAQKKSEKYFAD